MVENAPLFSAQEKLDLEVLLLIRHYDRAVKRSIYTSKITAFLIAIPCTICSYKCVSVIFAKVTPEGFWGGLLEFLLVLFAFPLAGRMCYDVAKDTIIKHVRLRLIDCSMTDWRRDAEKQFDDALVQFTLPWPLNMITAILVIGSVLSGAYMLLKGNEGTWIIVLAGIVLLGSYYGNDKG